MRDLVRDTIKLLGPSNETWNIYFSMSHKKYLKSYFQNQISMCWTSAILQSQV